MFVAKIYWGIRKLQRVWRNINIFDNIGYMT